jgi:hypothetical protein
MTIETISAVFDTRLEAEMACRHLRDDMGLTAGDIHLIDRESHGPQPQPQPHHPERGFWATMQELFNPQEELYTYGEAVSRGATLLRAQVPAARHDQALALLKRAGAIDLGDRAEAWRREGWEPGAPAAR